MKWANALAANAVGVTTGETNGERILRAAAAPALDAVIIGIVEGDDVSRLNGPVLDPDEWRIIHRGRDVARDGVLLALRRDRARLLDDPVWTLTAPEQYRGHPPSGTVDRYALTAPVLLDGGTRSERVRRVTVLHFVPPRSPDVYWTRQATAVRQINPDLLLIDGNASAARLRQAFPMRKVRVPSGDVMGAVGAHGMPMSATARRVRLSGSDHVNAMVKV